MMIIGVSPYFMVGIGVAIIAYIAMLRGLKGEDKISPMLSALGIIIIFSGLTLPSFLNFTENPRYMFLTIGLMGFGVVVVLYSFLRLWAKGEEEGEKRPSLIYLYLIAVFLLIIAPVVFFYLFNSGNPGMAYNISNILVGVSLLLMIMSVFGLSSFSWSSSESEESESESGGRSTKKKVKNPFRDLIKWAEKKGIFKSILLLTLIPFTLSLGYIIIYYPETPQSIVISNYNNYTISYMGENYAKITVEFPRETSTLDLTLVVLFREGHYEREILLSDNDTKVVYVKKIEGTYTVGIKNLFSTVGLYNFWLPMMIVFLIVYGLLAKILVVEEGGQFKPLVGKDVRILIAFAIALIFGASSMATRFVSSYLPYIGMGIIAIIGIALIFSLIFPRGLFGAVEKSKFFRIFIYYISFWLVIISLIAAIAPLAGTSLLEIMGQIVYKEYTLFDFLVTFAILLFIIIVIISYLSDYVKNWLGGSQG